MAVADSVAPELHGWQSVSLLREKEFLPNTEESGYRYIGESDVGGELGFDGDILTKSKCRRAKARLIEKLPGTSKLVP
jgi:hypothetical protein